MAKKDKPAKTSRKIGFGRREKLVAIGIAGILTIGALHFVIFKPRIDQVNAARADFEMTQADYIASQGHNFERRRVEIYQEATQQYVNQLLEIVRREQFSMASAASTEGANRGFRERVERLTRKWTEYAQTHDENSGTLLTFIGTQDPVTNPGDAAAIRAGRFRWNLPTALPPNVTPSAIRDALNQARGKYRLIELVRSEPQPHQDELNRQLRTLGIPVELVGADHITNGNLPWAWQPYRLVPRGVELANGDQLIPTHLPPPPPTVTNPGLVAAQQAQQQNQVQQWPSLRLPTPNDAMCALAHINLILDALYPPPFDDPALMERARQNPASLTPEQRQQYEQWQTQRTAERVGNLQVLGLEDLLDVQYDPNIVFYNLALDHVERMVDMAIDEGLTRVLLVKILKQVDLPAPPDPWEPPPPPTAEEQQRMAPSGAAGPMAMEAFIDPEIMAQMGGEVALFAQPQVQQQVAAAEPGIAFVAPIYLQVTGDYSRVMQFFLRLSTGDSFYTVEEFTITTRRADGTPFPNLPEGHVVADFWVIAPLIVPAIPAEIGHMAMAQAAAPPPPATPAPASPEPAVPVSPEAAAVPAG